MRELGLRELRARVNGHAGIGGDSTPTQSCVSAEHNYGTPSIEIARKYFDSGVLEQYDWMSL